METAKYFANLAILPAAVKSKIELAEQNIKLAYMLKKDNVATAAALGYSVDYVKRDLYRQALREVERRELLKPIIKRYGGAL